MVTMDAKLERKREGGRGRNQEVEYEGEGPDETSGRYFIYLF